MERVVCASVVDVSGEKIAKVWLLGGTCDFIVGLLLDNLILVIAPSFWSLTCRGYDARGRRRSVCDS